MIDLRALAEADLAYSLEGDYAAEITLKGPNGATQTVRGRVRYCKPRTNLDTGEVAYDFDPNITLRRSSLSPIPAADEKWSATFPDGPRTDAGSLTMLLDTTRAPEGGQTLGTIKYYMQAADQSEASS
jgi:hypothetical protein